MLRPLPQIALAAILALATAYPAASASAEPVEPEPRDSTSLLASAQPHGALGANFNQNLDSVNFRELRISGTDWVRGFFPMPATDEGDPADHFAVRTILETRDRGYQTIFSLKFPYLEKSFPAPGSAELSAELDRLDKVLPLVMGKVDIITVGNEPFVESRPEEQDERLNEFYEAMARHVIDFRAEQCGAECPTALYMGALNRLDLPEKRTPAAERWMTFVRETPEISGVDIHPHIPAPENARAFLDYILPRMRDDQTFLVTEFSLVWYWKEHLTDTVDPGFAERYGFDPDAQVYEVIQAAIDEPFSERQWRDFLESSPWFMAQSDFLRDQLALYRGTGKLAVSTYGFRQDTLMLQDFGPQKSPWLLNSVFAAYTVQPRGNGVAGPGYWLEQFRDLQ